MTKEQKAKYWKEYYEKNKERLLQRNKLWRKNNPERVSQLKKESFNRHRKRILKKDNEKRRLRKESGNLRPCETKEALKASRERNKVKKSAYSKKYSKENRVKINERRRANRKKMDEKAREKNPFWKIEKKIRGIVGRMKMKKKSERSIKYIGVSSVEEFFQKLSLTTSNKDWHLGKDHIDHIWQISWFEITEENKNDICYLINNIRNLRIISEFENLSRSRFDFSPLKEEDFNIYKPFLKNEILVKIEKYFSETSKTIL